MILVVLFPDGNNLFNGDVASLAVLVLQMQHAAVNLDYFATHAGSSAAKDVDPPADQIEK